MLFSFSDKHRMNYGHSKLRPEVKRMKNTSSVMSKAEKVYWSVSLIIPLVELMLIYVTRPGMIDIAY